MKKFTFIGCSITKGEGLPFEETDDNNYANIVGKHFSADVTNLSKSGNSNYNIFIASLNELLYNKPTVLVIQWSGLQRHWLYPDLDLELPIINEASVQELQYLNTYFSESFVKKFVQNFLLLNHDYRNLLALINYCKILETVATNQSRVVFVNGMLPWTKELQYSQAVADPAKNFSSYTKSLLSIDSLPDEDIKKFFEPLQNGISQLNKKNWINMFNAINCLSVDYGNDGAHPGPKSHQKIAKILIDHLTTNT